MSFRTFRPPLFSKPVSWLRLFFAVSYSKTALIQSSTSDNTITKINQLPSHCNYTISYEVNLHCSPRPYLFSIRKKYPTGFCFLSQVQYSQSHMKYLESFFWVRDKSLEIYSITKNIQQVLISWVRYNYQEFIIFIPRQIFWLTRFNNKFWYYEFRFSRTFWPIGTCFKSLAVFWAFLIEFDENSEFLVSELVFGFRERDEISWTWQNLWQSFKRLAWIWQKNDILIRFFPSTYFLFST